MKVLNLRLLCFMMTLVISGTFQYLQAQTTISGSSITLVGKDRAATKSSGSISVTLPSNIQPGDVTFLFLGQSDATDLSAPSGWTRIVTKGPADINQEALYRVYQNGQSTTYTFGGTRNKFVSIVTLRGVDNNNPVRAQWNGKDTDRGGESTCSSGHRGRAKATTSIATASNGVRFLTCMFDDPFVGEVFTSSSYSTRTMTILDAWKNGDDALMVAIEGTNGSSTSNRYIQGSNCATGGGNDIVFSITVNPSGSTPPPPPPPSTGEVVIDLCESTNGWSGSNGIVVGSDYQEGNGSIESSGQGTNDFQKSFAAKNAGTNDALSFWYYVSDKSQLTSNNQVELGSGGSADNSEYNWNLNVNDLQNGWNRIVLPFANAGTTGGTPDLTRLNWFRLYRFKSNPIVSRIDDVRLVQFATVNEVVIDLCESTSGWGSSNTLTTSSNYQEGNHSIKSVGSGTNDFQKNFATKNAGNNNVLSFWYYVSSVSRMNSSDQVELGSGGRADVNEYNWGISRNDLQVGWNKIELPFSAAGTTGGSPDLSRLNWFRLYRSKNNSITSRVDNIRLVNIAGKTAAPTNPQKPNTSSTQSFVTEQVDNFKIFPNPSNGYFKLLLNNPEDAATIRMFDLQGRIVLEQISNEPVMTFNVSNLAKGVYVVNVTNKQESKNIQLVVQ